MTLKDTFDRSKHLGELAVGWLKQFSIETEEAGLDLPPKITESDVASLIAPAALLANILVKEKLNQAGARKRILILGSDPIARLDRSIWIGYASRFLGIDKPFEVLQIRDEDPRSNLYETGVALGLKPSVFISADDLLKGSGPSVDLVLWIHPVAETPEHDLNETALAATYRRAGVPVYSCQFNELDLHVQNYAMSEAGVCLAPLGQTLTSGSLAVNRFGISSSTLGVTGGWGALLTRVDLAQKTVPKAHVSAVLAAIALMRAQGYETPGWTFGSRVNGVAFNRVLPVALLGNMAIDDRYGYVLTQQDKPRLLNVTGHAWTQVLAEMPETQFNLLHWASRLKLSFSAYLPKEPKRRSEVVDALTAAYQQGVIEAGIALARGYEALQTEAGRRDALALYKEIGDQHPMSAYVLAHHDLAENRRADAEAHMHASAKFGYPPAITDLGIIAFQNGMQDQGLALLKKSMTLGDSQAAFTWAENQIQRGSYPEALDALRKAWSIGHDEALNVAQWLAISMLDRGLGKRSVVKRELKDIESFIAKRKRLEDQVSSSA